MRISTPCDAELAGWPGDTPFRFSLAWSKCAGASVNVGKVETSIHTGTHVDAPYHFDDSGATVDQIDLAAFIGPAVVVDVRGLATIRPEDLDQLDLSRTPRILFRTDAWPDRSRFPEVIPTLDPATPAYLSSRGVVLVGFDLPSVDAIDSKTLPVHHALAASRVAILEGLSLSGVVPGEYELVALPVLWAGADGAPVRAILREWEGDSSQAGPG